MRAGKAEAVWGAGEPPAGSTKARRASRDALTRSTRSGCGPAASRPRSWCHVAGRPGYPAVLGADLLAAAGPVRPGRPWRPRRPTGHRRRHPQRHGRRPRGGRRAWAEAWPRHGVRRRVGPGARHRRLGPPRGAAGRRRRAADRRSWPAAPTSSTHPSTATSGTRSSPRASCSARCRPACRRMPSGSRSATASWPRSARWSSWSSRAHTGGSMLTVDEAIARGLTVMAVPGSPRNPAAEGTNQLLIDGATPVVGAVRRPGCTLGLARRAPPDGPAEPRLRRCRRRTPGLLALLGTDQRDHRRPGAASPAAASPTSSTRRRASRSAGLVLPPCRLVRAGRAHQRRRRP